MTKISIDFEAEVEIREAAMYYEEAREGLGRKFLNAIESAIEQIKEHPFIWRKITNKFRRSIVKDFPYGIIYSIEKKEIYIIAVMHLKRKPGYWKKRNKT